MQFEVFNRWEVIKVMCGGLINIDCNNFNTPNHLISIQCYFLGRHLVPLINIQYYPHTGTIVSSSSPSAFATKILVLSDYVCVR